MKIRTDKLVVPAPDQHSMSYKQPYDFEQTLCKDSRKDHELCNGLFKKPFEGNHQTLWELTQL
jgi:hypothetical protein